VSSVNTEKNIVGIEHGENTLKLSVRRLRAGASTSREPHFVKFPLSSE